MPRFLPQLNTVLLTGLLTVWVGVVSAETDAVDEAPVQDGLADARDASLTVQVSGLAQVSGNLFIALYDSEETWLGDETVLLLKVVIEDHRSGELVEVPIELPAGEYAMTVFYDVDDNGELNTNFIGMPKEPIALSNNATGKFGPPKYVDAAFDVGAEPVLQSIKLEEL